jgi:osmoprotectant transport system substrate-binding protein
MYLLLENEGFDVNIRTGLSTTVLREGLENGDLDLYMEYTGTGWLTHLGNEFAGESPEEMYEKMETADAEKGLVWFEPIWCNNTYVVAMPAKLAQENNLTNLSEFAAYVTGKNGNVKISTTNEFYARPDGIKGLEAKYGFKFDDKAVTPVQPGVQKNYLIEGKVDCTVAFGTDSEIVKYNWTTMLDDKNFWPPYDLCPVTRTEVLDANKGLERALKKLVNAFPSDPAEARQMMTALNAKVDIDKMEPEEVAEEWLKEKGLID